MKVNKARTIVRRVGYRSKLCPFVASLVWLAACLTVHAASPIPLNLPRPDGQPGDATKPVKVYIIAGQSNMVGMGDLTGARPEFPRVYYSADPAILPGATPIGRNERGSPLSHVAVERLNIFDAKANGAPVALGTASQNLPVVADGQTLVVTAQIEVPISGNFFVRAGFGESTFNTVTLDGKEVSAKDASGKLTLNKITLEAGKRYPVQIRYTKSGSAAFWLERVDIPANGDLVTITKRDKKFPYLIDDAGNWTVRNDVYFQEARLVEGGKGAPMSAESNKKCLPKCGSIGPEVGLGFVLGTFHDEQVLIIKTAQGNRSLNFDFRPPSSGKGPNTSDYESFEYRAMIKGVRETLAKIDQVVPGYKGQGYEIAGFGWFQGHKDSGSTKEEYEKHLVNLINDLRAEFKAPNMKAVVATVGFHGYRIFATPWYGIWQAQMAVGDPEQHPEFAGNVASVDTRDFWREVDESPRGQDYHYNRNAETYMLVGEAMGRAMVRLQGGQAEEIPKSDREAKVKAEMAAETAKPEPTDAQKAAHTAAIKPFILDSSLTSFVGDAKTLAAVKAAMKVSKPAKPSPYLADTLDDVVQFYQAAGVHDYDWQPFGGDLKNSNWSYFAFDLPGNPGKFNVSSSAGEEEGGGDDNSPENPPPGNVKEAPKAPKPADIPKEAVSVKWVLPAGMDKWFATDFDATKAGWKTGPAPFGESAEKLKIPEWASRRIPARKPQTVIASDALLMRQTVELPPLQDGYRYRIRVAGSLHNNMGEGYAIYVNGQQLADNHEGVLGWRRQGPTPRGVMIYPDTRELLKGSKITLAVSHFPMDNWTPGRYVPPGAAVSVWIEQQKLPTVGE